MKARPYRSKYNETFSDYSDYFTVAIHSHFSALVLALWRLHDPKAPAMSLQTLPGRMGLRPDIPVEMLRNYRDRLRPVGMAVSGLHTIRHKFFAHRDPGYTVEQAFKEADLKYGDLKKLIDASAAALTMFLRARRLGTLTFARPMDGRPFVSSEFFTSMRRAPLTTRCTGPGLALLAPAGERGRYPYKVRRGMS